MPQLRIPGPTTIPDKVLQAQGRQMINHRGPEFKDILTRCTERLQQFFRTKGEIFILTGSGTGGLEASIVNTLSPGDKVLSVSVGVFGERYAKIAATFGAEVVDCKFDFGQSADPAVVAAVLEANPDVKAVLVTHNETSTGVVNDLAALSKVIKGAGKLLLVDAISSMGSVPLPVDEWGCDIVVTASQKGWMVAPGLCIVSVSEAARKAGESATMPRFYWDFAQARDYYTKGQTPWTPAVTEFFALDTALDMLLAEGVDNIHARHTRIATKVREGVKALGLELFAAPGSESDTITSVAAGKGLDTRLLVKIMREEKGIVLSGGQQSMDGKIFRIGHLGFVNEGEIDELLAALKESLPKAGFGSG